MEIKSSLMAQFTKEVINTDTNMEMEGLADLMEVIMKEVLKITTFKDLACLCTRMEIGMKENELKARCMEKERLSGIMGKSILENFSLTVNMGKALFTGLMEGFIKEVGRMTRSMEKEFTLL